MRKILITGGLGFIGSHTITSLLQEGEQIFCIDNLINSEIKTIYKINKITSSFFEYRKISISDKKLKNFIEKYNISNLIHFAGLKSIEESVKYPAKYYYNNVIGTKLLLDCVKYYNFENIIFSSSATVYGKPLYLPVDEKHIVQRSNPYANSKIDIENIILNDPYFQNNCSVKILRYFNPIGAHPSGLIGESPVGKPNNLMPFILKVAKKEYSKLKIFGNDYETLDGTGIRDYIHIMDLIDGHIRALNFDKKGISIFNLGTGRGTSVLNIVKTFEKINNIKIPFCYSDRRLGDVSEIYADSSKAKNILGFVAKKGIEEMCLDAWRYSNKKNV